MLNVFRENLKSLKWLLWIVAISMTLYLGAFFFGGSSSGDVGNWAAKVDGREISQQDMINLTASLDRQYQSMFGEQYSQLRPSLRLGSQAMQTLIQRELILEDAKRLGIRATPEDVATAIRENPAFQDAEGNFIGADRYTRFFAGRPGGVAGFERAIGDDIVIQRWEQIIGQGITVGDAELEAAFRQRNEKTAIKYTIVASADQEVDQTVTDEQVRAWYDAHQDSYERGEARRIRYAVVKRADQLEKVEVTDAEIAASYEANRASYESPEQRQARHILLRSSPEATEAQKAELRAEAESLLERVKNGEDFAALAGERSEDPGSGSRGGDLGWFGRGAMVPAFDSAVFNTAVGEYAPVTETQFGFHVIQVTDAREAGVTPLEEVRDQIEQNLRQKKADERMTAEAARIAQRIRTAATLDGIAAEEGLSVQSMLVTEDDPLPDLGASPDFLPAVFEAEVGATTQPLRVLEGMAIVAVDETVPAGVAPLDEVASKVRTDVLNDRAQQAALAAANEARDAKDLEAAVKKIGLQLTESGDLNPRSQLPRTGGLPDDVREMLFGDAVVAGDRGAAIVPAGAMVWEVTSHQGFDADHFASEQDTLRLEIEQRRRNQLRQSVINGLREGREIVVNNELVQRFDG